MKMRVIEMWIDAAVKRCMGKTRKAIKATDRRLNKTTICLHDVTLNCEANSGSINEIVEQLQSVSDAVAAQDSPLPRSAPVVVQDVEADEHDTGRIRVLQGRVNDNAQQIEGHRQACINEDQSLAKQNAQLRGQITSLAGTVDELAKWKAQVDQAARTGKGGVLGAAGGMQDAIVKLGKRVSGHDVNLSTCAEDAGELQQTVKDLSQRITHIEAGTKPLD